MSLSEKAKTAEIPCVECEVFQKTKTHQSRAWLCETARTCGKCLMMKRLEDAKQEIDDCKASWQNLKDTIPKFDAKISFLETRLKACNRLIDEMQRERGEQKQKLSDVIHSYLVAYPLKTKLDREVCKVLRGIAKDMGLME